MTPPLLRIGTRGSKLALVQAGLVRDALAARVPELAAPDAIEIVIIRTTGDAIQDRPLAEAGGKGLFIKEIEEALLGGASISPCIQLKDMPTVLPRRACRSRPSAARGCARRADRGRLGASPTCGRARCVGTAALRRKAQLLHLPARSSDRARCAAMSTRGSPSASAARSMRPCWRWPG